MGRGEEVQVGGGYVDVWTDGEWVDEYVEGYTDEEGNWQDGYWTSNWREGYWSQVWEEPYTENRWVDGEWVTTEVPGSWEQQEVGGFWEDVWLEPTTQNVWIEAYDMEVWVDDHWTLVWGPWSVEVWIDPHWEGEWTWVATDIYWDWYWHPWSPETSTRPCGSTFTQTRDGVRPHVHWETNEAGEIRNFTSFPDYTTETNPNAVGTQWVRFSEPGPWSYTAWSPDPGTVAAGQSFTQTRTANRTIRSGDRDCAGAEHNVTTTTQSDPQSQPATGTGNTPPTGAPTITVQPVSKNVGEGQVVQLHAEAAGNPAPTLRWKRNGTVLGTGPTRLGLASTRLTLIDASPADGGNYSLEATNSQGTATSNTATVTVSPGPTNLVPAIVTQPQSAQISSGASVSLSVVAHGVGTLRFRWRKNDVLIPGATASSFALSAAQAGDAGAYTVDISNEFATTRSNVARLTVGAQTTIPSIGSITRPARQNVPFFLDLAATNPDPGAAGTSWASAFLPAGLTLNSSSGVISGTPTATGLFNGWYTASNAGGASSQAQLTINVLSPTSPPWIFSQPVNQLVDVNTPLRITAYAATGSDSYPLQRQWYKDGVALSGETLAEFSVASAQASDAGSYYVVISNPASDGSSGGGTVTSLTATVAVRTGSGRGSPPSGGFVYPIVVTKPNGTTISISDPGNLNVVDPVGGVSVGDRVAVTMQAADPDGNLHAMGLQVFAPDVANLADPNATGVWNYSAEQNWVTPGDSNAAGNPFLYYYPQDDANRTNPVARSVNFTLDSPGVWKFRVEVSDDLNQRTTLSSQNSLDLRVRNPTLSAGTAAIPNPSGRLVGAYFNAGQVHNSFGRMWVPPNGRWEYRWGPNPVAPLMVDWISPTGPAKTINQYFYMGFDRIFEVPNDIDTAKEMCAELAYAGVDFVILDHTNLVFGYPRIFSTTTVTDNPVTRGAAALKAGFAAYAAGGGAVPASGVRPKITFMLGLTTTWYTDDMDSAHPALRLEPRVTSAATWTRTTIDEYIERRTIQFNDLLQTLWDNHASDPAVWQYDPANNRPLLFLYVGTDGPAMHWDPVNAMLDDSIAFNLANPRFCFKIVKNGVSTPIDQAFSIKYVAAFTASGGSLGGPTLRDAVSVARDMTGPGGTVTAHRYYKKHWSFREFASTPVGTLDSAQTYVDAFHVTAYRAAGPGYFSSELDAAIRLKPRFLVVTCWNEFGSLGDEPSPDESWTIMSNNKYGRGYTEILRNKVTLFKAP